MRQDASRTGRIAALLALGISLLGAGCAGPETSTSEQPPPQAPAAKSPPAVPAAQEAAPPAAPSAKPQPPKLAAPQSRGGQELERGVRSYEDGEYKAAARELRSSLELGLESNGDRARAYKYLAFISCAAGREKACRADFRRALDADPQFDLEPAEAGHPIWGPVWQSVKAERAGKSKAK